MPKAVNHALGRVALDLVDVFIPTKDAINRCWLSIPVVDRALIPGFFGVCPRHIIRTFLLFLSSDKIPHMLELDKLILAVDELLLFDNLQLFCLLLHYAILDVVLANFFIGCFNHLGARLRLS